MVRDYFGYFAICSVVVAFISGVLLEGTYGGIVTTCVMLGLEAFLVFMIKKMKGNICDGSKKYIIYSICLSLSLSFTNNQIMSITAFLGVLMLDVLFLYHQFDNDAGWGFVGVFHKLTNAALLPIRQLGSLFEDIRSVKNERKINPVYLSIGLGIIIMIPLVVIISIILMSADGLFEQVVHSMFRWIDLEWLMEFDLWRLIKFIFISCFVYGFFSYILNEQSFSKDNLVKKHQPVTAIVVYSCLTALYLLFCLVQLGYLLSIDNQVYIYANGAREGFFQLVFVAFFNLVLVINGIHRMEKSKWLNRIMFVMSICTYGMMLSAIVKMIMYINVFHMTVLRLMVMWAIIVIAIVFVGVIKNIKDEEFNLYKFAFHTFTVAFIILSLARPDAVVAKYNLKIAQNYNDFRYMKRNLCIDIIPDVVAAKVKYGDNKEFQALVKELEKDLDYEMKDRFSLLSVSEIVGNMYLNK